MILDKEIDSYMYASVSRDPDFEQVYDSYDVTLFKRTDWSFDTMLGSETETETEPEAEPAEN